MRGCPSEAIGPPEDASAADHLGGHRGSVECGNRCGGSLFHSKRVGAHAIDCPDCRWWRHPCSVTGCLAAASGRARLNGEIYPGPSTGFRLAAAQATFANTRASFDTLHARSLGAKVTGRDGTRFGLHTLADWLYASTRGNGTGLAGCDSGDRHLPVVGRLPSQGRVQSGAKDGRSNQLRELWRSHPLRVRWAGNSLSEVRS